MSIIAREEILGGPFSSTSVVETVNGFPRGNKAVDAAFLASMVSCFITDGIVKNIGEEFTVYPAGDLSVSVSAGCAWGNGYMAKSDGDVYFELDSGHEYTVFLRFNGADGSATLMVYEDNAGMIPMRTASLCDLVLAEITVAEDALEIAYEDITDTRGDSLLCGYVSSKI